MRPLRFLCPVIAALLLTAYGESAHASQAMIPAWQTYCAVPHSNVGEPGTITVERVGRASPNIRSAHLFVHEGQLRVWDHANSEQFTLKPDGSFDRVTPVPCARFQAYGWTFWFGGGQSTACRGDECVSIAVRDATLAFTFAAHDGAVFVGSAFGDALLFRDERWCRMVKHGDEWACPDTHVLPPIEPSNQFYSSAIYEGRTLIGEYPTGHLFEFDGERVFRSDIPRPLDGHALESQVLMPFCGSLFVGYWHSGTIYRWDGKAWHGPIRLFHHDADYPQFSEQAERAGQIFNFFGRRAPSLVPYNGALYAITASKGDWNTSIDDRLPDAVAAEYGVVWRLTCNR